MQGTKNYPFCIFSTRAFDSDDLFGESSRIISPYLVDCYASVIPDLWQKVIVSTLYADKAIDNAIDNFLKKDLPVDVKTKYEKSISGMLVNPENLVVGSALAGGVLLGVGGAIVGAIADLAVTELRKKVLKKSVYENIDLVKIYNTTFNSKILLYVLYYTKELFMEDDRINIWRDFKVKVREKLKQQFSSDTEALKAFLNSDSSDDFSSIHISDEDKKTLLTKYAEQDSEFGSLCSLYSVENCGFHFFAVHCLPEKYSIEPEKWIDTLISIGIHEGFSEFRLFLHDRDIRDQYGGCDFYVAKQSKTNDKDKDEWLFTNLSVDSSAVKIVFFQHTANDVVKLLKKKNDSSRSIMKEIKKSFDNYDWRLYLIECIEKVHQIKNNCFTTPIPDCPIFINDCSVILEKLKEFESIMEISEIMKTNEDKNTVPTELFSVSKLKSLSERDIFSLLSLTFNSLL